jgi:cell division transport system permease protein
MAMSGSYDRPSGSAAQARMEHDPYGSPTSETTYSARARPPPKLETGGEPHGRSRRKDRSPTTGPIVPAGSVTGRSLTLVITIMCFLACLTAGAVYMMNQSASAWLRDIASTRSWRK